MNTYFKTANLSTEFFAVRDAKNFQPENATRVPATAKLRELARISAIPTYRVLLNGKLGRL